MSSRWSAGLLAICVATAGVRASLRVVDPDTAYYIQTALILIVALVTIVILFAVSSKLVVWLMNRLFQSRFERDFTLFLGWNLLRSQRQVDSLATKHRKWIGVNGRNPAARFPWRVLGVDCARIGALTAVAAAAAYGGWRAWQWAEPLGDPERASAEGAAFVLLGIVLLAATDWVRTLDRLLWTAMFHRRGASHSTRHRVTRTAVTTPNFISMVGVGIGVWALILVLSVMGGFQSDLRDKILDTNAHVLVQPPGAMGQLENARDAHREIAALGDIASADAFVEQDGMIASAFSSSVQLTVRGIPPTGALASRIAAATLDGSVAVLEAPHALSSDRGWDLAVAPERGVEPPTRPVDRPAPTSPDAIELPPMPGGAPPKTAAASPAEIVIPPMPGGAPRPAVRAHPVVLSEIAAKNAGVALGDTVQLVVLSADQAPDGEAGVVQNRSEVRVVGVARQSPDDADRHDVVLNPAAFGAVAPGRKRALGWLGERTRTPLFIGAASPNSPAAVSLERDLVAGSVAALFSTGENPSENIPQPKTNGAASGNSSVGSATGKPGWLPLDNPLAVPLDRVLPPVVLGVELADSLRVRVGDEVQLIALEGGVGPTGVRPRSVSFAVAAVFRTGVYEHDLKVAYTSVPDAQRFFDLGSGLNRIEIRLDDPNALESTRPAIAAAVQADAEILDWMVLNRSLFSALGLERLVMFLMLGMIIIVASFNIVSSESMLVQEKSREIAIVRTMGGTESSVRKAFLFLGLFVGLTGAVTGTALGLICCLALDWVGVPLPPEYYIDFVPVRINPLDVVAAASIAVAISLLATLYPSSAAARLRPVEGLRYE